jgi:predicted RND superfamily exporter protein
VVVALGLALAMVSLLAARQLPLFTEFDQLLPESQPSVREYRRVESRLTNLSKIFVVLENGDRSTLRRFGDRLVARLGELGPPAVISAEDGPHEARDFFLPRAGLFATVSDLTSLRDDIRNHWNDAVGRAMGVDLDEDAPRRDVGIDRIRSIAGPTASLLDRYPDGYYETQAGDALVVVAHTGIRSGDLEGARAALDRVKAVVASEAAAPELAGVRIGYAGDLVTGLSEYGAVRNDLIHVGTVGILLVLGVILLYFGRLRPLFALGTVIFAGCAWTFALTRFAIGHLNVVTGFLFSIIAGNGINCGIIYLARYLERRKLGHSAASAIRTAHRETWLPTLTAAAAAAASYSALAVSDFRGLKHFAFIGGAGMICCWLATYLLLPSLLVLLDGKSAREPRWRGSLFGAPFAALVRSAPAALSVVGLSISLLGTVFAFSYLRTDPMEYDMKRLFNQVGGGNEQKRLSTLARNVIGIDGESSMALACDRPDQVPLLAKALRARRNAAPESRKPFEAVHTLDDLVAPEQATKIPLLAEIRRLVVRAHARGLLADQEWKEAQALLPPSELKAYGVADLPASVARVFTEKDGTRGLLVYIEPTHGEDEDDAHYLIRWADSFRETVLPGGETIRGSGRVVIFADMLRAVLSDVPKVTILALSLTVLVVALSAGLGWESFAIVGALMIGVAWLFVWIIAMKVKLNFLNFIALPITFGIGVDYAVNIVRRYRENPHAGPLAVLRSTGGAVVLCSLTTILGYLALLGSKNQAVHSLGLLAVLGEVCCLLAAMLVLPAILLLLFRRASAARKPDQLGSIVSSSGPKWPGA